MKDKLILKNGTEIELESGASLNSITILFTDKTSMVSTWDMFTPDNLSEVQIKNGDGLVVGNYNNLLLVSETSIVLSDGNISTSFNIREKTDIELRLDAVEESQEVQDGAISDLGEVVSVLSEA